MGKNYSIKTPSITAAFKGEISRVLNKMLPVIKEELDVALKNPSKFEEILKYNNTMEELMDKSSDLRGQLGIPARWDGQKLLRAISKSVANGVLSKYQKFNVRSPNAVIEQKITLDVTKLLKERFAYYQYVRSRTFWRGRTRETVDIGIQEIYWLSWLLLEGNNVIVSGYSVYNPPETVVGRSGLRYLMKKRGIFKVPANHAGTVKNNFITRALYSYSDDLVKELRLILRAGVKKAKIVAQKEARRRKR